MNYEATKMKLWLPDFRDDGFEFDGYVVSVGYPNEYLGRCCFAAFDMGTCEEIAGKFAEYVSMYDFGVPEQFPLFLFSEETGCWEEYYYDGLFAEYEPIEVDGATVYALGGYDWSWEC